MKRQIIKQNNGLYAVFSFVVDNIVYYSATREEIIKEYLSYPSKPEFKLSKREVELLVDKQLKESDSEYVKERALQACKRTNGYREYKRILDIIKCL